MTIVTLISIAVFLLGLGCGAALWFVFRYRRVVKSKKPIKITTAGGVLTFRWGYIMLPIAILCLSIILVAYFYHLLPTEVAYHFKFDGSADKWLSRGRIIAWMLTPQFLLTLLAGAIAWGMTKLGGLSRQPGSTGIKVERILLLMGNMVAMPQIILCFAMVDIFSYNSYQIHLMPLWIFALIIVALGGIILGIFFIQAMRQAWRASR